MQIHVFALTAAQKIWIRQCEWRCFSFCPLKSNTKYCFDSKHVVCFVSVYIDCLSLTSLPFSCQASHYPQPFQPSTSCFSSAWARGGLATFPSVTWVSMHCVWWWASSLLVTWFVCTCTRVCWPRPCSPPTVCGPGRPLYETIKCLIPNDDINVSAPGQL